MAGSGPLQGVAGILRPFREYIAAAGVTQGDQVVFYGVPGTCTPFVELLGFAIRSLGAELIYVPYLDEAKARLVQAVENVGMQASAPAPRLSPKVIVVMGGLAMPGMPVNAGQVRDMAATHPGSRVVGICFMSMFDKAGWLPVIPFDFLIDANIGPVEVMRKD